MLSALGALLLLHPGGPTVAAIDGFAQKRDVDSLTRLLAPLPAGVRNPFHVLRTGGAYSVGKFGWHAVEFDSADNSSSYIVIGTPLTSEDVGEILLKRNGDRLELIPEDDAMGARVTHHAFDLRFDVPKKHAYLVDTADFTFAANAPAAIIFRMSPGYDVRRISDESGKAVPFKQGRGVVSMLRPKTPTAKLKIEYDAEVNLPLYAGSVGDSEATLVNDYWYPMIARMPASYEITVHSPKGWATAGQGVRISEKETSTERVTSYRMDLPVTYFSVISAPFKVRSQRIGARRFTIWSARMTPQEMQVQSEFYASIIDFYATHFGEPPYPAYGAVDSKTYGGGALEAYTFATYGDGLPALDAHEPSHTWWGGLINNTYLHSFWNESFADFSDAFYHREVNIGNQDERRHAFVADSNGEPDYNAASMEQSGADVGPPASSLGYGKGAKVLQMMEQEFGTDAVVNAMRTWISTHPKGEPGEWEQFEKIFLDQNPTPQAKAFVADWFRRPGYADFDADVSYASGAVKLRPKWKTPRFQMPLDVMLQWPDGLRMFRTLTIEDGKDEYEIKAPGKPSLVSLDPWRRALRKFEANEEPIQLDSVVGRMKKVVEPGREQWMTRTGGKGTPASKDADFAGKFIIGSPETWPALKPLFVKAGFMVHGNHLTYKGTDIDLDHGSALAVVDLGGDKRCVIGLGKTRFAPEMGRARLVVTNDLGRFLRGVTDPKTSGKLTYRL